MGDDISALLLPKNFLAALDDLLLLETAVSFFVFHEKAYRERSRRSWIKRNGESNLAKGETLGESLTMKITPDVDIIIAKIPRLNK